MATLKYHHSFNQKIIKKKVNNKIFLFALKKSLKGELNATTNIYNSFREVHRTTFKRFFF